MFKNAVFYTNMFAIKNIQQQQFPSCFSTSRRHSQSLTGSSKPPPPPTFLVTNHIQNRNRIHRNSLGIVVGSTSPQSNHRSRSFDGRELSGAPTFFENDESRRHSVSSCTRISGTYNLLTYLQCNVRSLN
jgi:hypothetical protein